MNENPNFYERPENRWILFRSAAYLGKLGITFGEAIVPRAARAPDTGSTCVDTANHPWTDVVADHFTPFKDNFYNHVFLGRKLQDMRDSVKIIKDLSHKLVKGGHFIVHCETIAPDMMKKALSESGRYGIKTEIVRNNQYLGIFKKLEGQRGLVETPFSAGGRKQALIARYGALGDMIILTPLMKKLHDNGYHVTLNISPYCAPVVWHNPNYDNIVLQEKDMIPNQELGPYWKEWAQDYDRYINLSESLEGKLLKVEGRPDYFTPKSWRIANGNFNYYDHTMKLGGYPEVTGQRGQLFFSTAEERDWAKFIAPYRNKFIIIWALNGSSFHKLHASTELMLEEWLRTHEDSVIFLTGAGNAPKVSYEHPRLIPTQGSWPVRKALIAAKHASLIIGPESMLVNAAGCFDTPKIVFMSHSLPETLTKYWTNCQALEPSLEVAPCYPCFQLHYTFNSCPIKEMQDKTTGQILAKGPSCTLNAIAPELVIEAMERVYSQKAAAA